MDPVMLETQNIKVKIGQEPARLSELAENIWVFRADLKLLGLDIGCCMTVVKLSDGSLLLHSPIEHTKQISTSLETLGCVKYIVAPNSFHHLFISPYLDQYDADFYTVEDVAKKRHDIANINVLADGDSPPWGNDFEWTIVKGKRVQEIVLFHKLSRTLILTDMAFNIPDPIHPARLVWHRMIHACGKFSPSRVGKMLFGKTDDVQSKMALIQSWDFKRIIVSHGSPVTENAKETFEKGMKVLLKA